MAYEVWTRMGMRYLGKGETATVCDMIFVIGSLSIHRAWRAYVGCIVAR